MIQRRTYPLRLYSTTIFISMLLGIILMGIIILFGLQNIWSVSRWIQYAFLTAWLIASFLTASYLSTKPARVSIEARTIMIEKDRKKGKRLSFDNIIAYAHYNELILYSLKISLRDNKTLSIISFKWDDNSSFLAFLKQFQSVLESVDNKPDVKPVLASKTFYNARSKVIISTGLLVIYAATAITFSIKNIFDSWNPICVYFFWTLPVLFFIKMWKAK